MFTAKQRGVSLYLSNEREKLFSFCLPITLVPFCFRNILRMSKPQDFSLKISLRHDIGRNSVINSNSSRLVLEFSFYG
jgi:hypothetical protein